MCEGNASILVTSKGQVIVDKMTNSHAKIAEKYLGSSEAEDKCFQPELDFSTRRINVNRQIYLTADRIRPQEITTKVAKSIVEYFNKYYSTVAKIRQAIAKCKKENPDWINSWSRFKQVLKSRAINKILDSQISELVNKYDIKTNLDSEVQTLAKIEASKDKENLIDLWKNPKPFTMKDIFDKGTGRILFA